MTSSTTSGFSSAAHPTVGAATGVLVLAIRAAAFIAFVMLSIAEPFLAVILGALSLACFFVAVLFGFILHAPFQHRWFVLGASVVFLMAYVLYRFAMLGLQRLMR